jgi:hypothetical protein
MLLIFVTEKSPSSVSVPAFRCKNATSTARSMFCHVVLDNQISLPGANVLHSFNLEFV